MNDTSYCRKPFLPFLILLACIACCGFMPQRAAADQIRVPKVISIVYDDSSSMRDTHGHLGKAEYANYAVKAFLALLDTDDTVYVTLMSNPEKAHRLSMHNGQDQAISQLNAMIDDGMTPFQSVRTAMDALQSVHKSDVASEYWLVIFTDGSFTVMNTDGMKQALHSFLHTTMPNGSLPQVCYIPIGKNAQYPETAMDGLALYPKSGTITQNEDIFRVMRSMSDRISGRAKLDGKSISFNGNTVTFTTEFPCFSFAFLQQSDLYPWVSLVDASGNELTGSFVHIETEGFQESLSGWASKVLPAKNQILPAGTYTLTFRQQPQDLVIMTEPALVLDLILTACGSGDTGLYSIFRAGEVDVQGFLHVWQETMPVTSALLPKGTTYSLKAIQGGNTLRETSDALMTLQNVKITNTETLFSAAVELPGMGVVTAKRSITAPSYTLSLRQEGSDTYSLNELVGNTRGITATILLDGTPISASKAAALKITVETTVPHTVTQQNDGSFRIVPSIDCLKPLSCYGRQTITVGLEGAVGLVTPSTAAWTIELPVIQVYSSVLGTDTMPRTLLRSSKGLLQTVQTSADLAGQAEQRVVAAFSVSVNDQQLTGEELRNWQPVAVALSGAFTNQIACETTTLSDGTILAVPLYAAEGALEWNGFRWIDSWHLPTGQAILTCTVMRETSAAQPFTIVLEPWHILVLHMVLPVIFVILVLGYIFKRRFARKAVVYWIPFQKKQDRYTSGAESWHAEPLRRLNVWSFVPYAAARTKAGGLTFFAGSPSSILVPLESLPIRSQLIAKKRCAQQGIFSCNAEDKNSRPVHVDGFEECKSHRCVLSDDDVLLFTGDKRSGRAYRYSRD